MALRRAIFLKGTAHEIAFLLLCFTCVSRAFRSVQFLRLQLSSKGRVRYSLGLDSENVHQLGIICNSSVLDWDLLILSKYLNKRMC